MKTPVTVKPENMHLKLILLGLLAGTLLGVSADEGEVQENQESDSIIGEDKSFIIDGVDTRLLTDEELEQFIEAEDDKLFAEIDIWSGKKAVEEKNIQTGGRRIKRWGWVVPAARSVFSVGRTLIKSYRTWRPVISRSAGKITKQYFKKGNMRTAVRDFRKIKPDNVRKFSGKNGLKGREGTFGNGKWTVKVRSSSSSGKPTMDVYRTKKADRKVLRKVRYD